MGIIIIIIIVGLFIYFYNNDTGYSKRTSTSNQQSKYGYPNSFNELEAARQAFNEAELFSKKGQFNNAIHKYTEAIKYKEKGTYYNNRAHAKTKNKDYNGAIFDYTRAIRLSPNHALFYANRGMTHYNYNNLELACKDWEKAFQLGSSNAKIWREKHCISKPRQPINHSSKQEVITDSKKPKPTIFRNRKSQPDKVLYYGFYHPYRHGNNPDFDTFSANILDLKNNSISGINYFFNLLKNYIVGNFTIVIVPSHDPKKVTSGIKSLAIKLVNANRTITNGTNCLIRTNKISKLATGGNRNLEVHLKSMKVQNISLIYNKNVLLLDDVTTTNNSLIAGRTLLLKAGAKAVQSFALGQTS